MMITEVQFQYHSLFLEIKEGIAIDMYKTQMEFDEWLKDLRGNNVFQEYHEFIDNGEIVFSGYVNTFGIDEFIAWINVDKYGELVAWKIDKPSTQPDQIIYF